MLGDNAAVGVLLTVGADKKEWLVNAGYRLDARQRFIVTAGQLEQFLDYSFRSGSEKVGMTQNSGAVSYQLQLGQEFLRFLEVNGYVAKTASRDLADKTFAVDTATLYELWNDPRRIAGGKVTGAQAQLGFSPLAGSTVKVSIGQERLSYDLLAGMDSVNRLTHGVEWQQQVGSGYQIKAAADTFAAQNRYTLGVERSLAGNDGRHNLGISLIGLRGRDGLGDDNQLKLSYTYVFGAGSGNNAGMALRAKANTSPDLAALWSGGSLLDQVAMRPRFIPSHVVAKIDNTALPTRLIAVDKTALPLGATVNAATGDISTPLGVAVTGIAGVTKNLGVFTNTGQFILSGNSLVVKPSLIVQPAVGVVDSYVVTLNNSGGGTTLVTVLVSHGSVKIDSIAITAGGAGDVTAPVTTSAPAISVAATGTTASVTQTINENGTGYYLMLPAASVAPSVADVKAGTSFAMTANTPAVASLSGLAGGTAYKYYFVAKDAANNDQAAVSAGLAITTTGLAAPANFVLSNDTGISSSDGIINQQPAVSWMAVAGAVNYEVWGGTSWTGVGTATSGQFGVGQFPTPVGDGDYTIKVRAIGGPESSMTVKVDTVAPTKTGESFGTLAAGITGSSTMSFNEPVAEVTAISFKRTVDGTLAGGSISVSGGLGTNTLTFNWTAPNLYGDDAYVELVIKDFAGNSRTVTSNNYGLW